MGSSMVTAQFKWWVAVAFLLPVMLQGQINQVNETILSPTGITNYTGYIIDSDAGSNNPAFNRDSILFNALVRSTNGGPMAATRSNYYVFRLLDTNSVPFPIYDVTGGTNASYTYNLSICSPFPVLRLCCAPTSRPSVRRRSSIPLTNTP